MGTDLRMNNTGDSKATCLFAEAVVTVLLCSSRNTAVFSTERFSFFNHSSHPKSDQGETADECAPTLAKTPRRSEAPLLPGLPVGLVWAGSEACASAQLRVSGGFICSQALLVDA